MKIADNFICESPSFTLANFISSFTILIDHTEKVIFLQLLKTHDLYWTFDENKTKCFLLASLVLGMNHLCLIQIANSPNGVLSSLNVCIYS